MSGWRIYMFPTGDEPPEFIAAINGEDVVLGLNSTGATEGVELTCFLDAPSTAAEDEAP